MHFCNSIMIKNFKWHFGGCLTIQARRFASRSSTRQTNSLNSDKKVNSKPSETGRSPLNRLANRPVILRSSAYFEFFSFSFFRVFSVAFCFGRCFPAPSFFTTAKTIFHSCLSMTLLPENIKKTTQNLLQPIHAFYFAYGIIVDVTTTSHFGTFRSHRCPCICQFPVV